MEFMRMWREWEISFGGQRAEKPINQRRRRVYLGCVERIAFDFRYNHLISQS